MPLFLYRPSPGYQWSTEENWTEPEGHGLDRRKCFLLTVGRSHRLLSHKWFSVVSCTSSLNALIFPRSPPTHVLTRHALCWCVPHCAEVLYLTCFVICVCVCACMCRHRLYWFFPFMSSYLIFLRRESLFESRAHQFG